MPHAAAHTVRLTQADTVALEPEQQGYREEQSLL